MRAEGDVSTTRTEPTPQHTPTPWRAEHVVDNQRSGIGRWLLLDAEGHPVLYRCTGSNARQFQTINRIVRAVNSHAALVEALEPFANFFEKFSAKPLRGIGDEFYGIHHGTEWAASIRISDMKRAAEALAAAKGTK